MSSSVCPREIVDCSHAVIPFHPNRLFQPIRFELSHIQRVFRKAYRRVDGFMDSEVLVCYYHHSCHRSDRTSLLIVTDQIQSVRRSICTRQLICSHVISFLVKLIGSMIYTGYIHLADEVSLDYLYSGVLHLFCLD